MKSRKVKAYQAHKRVKANIALKDDDSDVDSDSFLHDEIEDFDNEKDDKLSTDDELIQHKDDSSEEEEVLPITDDEKDESDEDDDDLEKNESEDEEQGLPKRAAWGKKKSAYYSADFVDEDKGRTYREDDAEAAKAEAEEALTIQKSLHKDVKADNLGVNLFLEGSEESSGEDENVNIVSATKEEKMRYLKTHTKLFEVMNEGRMASREYRKYIILYDLVEKKKIRSKNLVNVIVAKTKALSLYTLNLTMYLFLYHSGENMKNHPVLKRLAQFKELLEKIKPADDVCRETFDEWVEKVNKGEEVDFCSEPEEDEDTNKKTIVSALEDSSNTVKPKKVKDSSNVGKPEKIKKTKIKHVETENEKQVMELNQEVKEEMRKRKYEDLDGDINENVTEPNQGDEEMDNSEEKRMITYQIAKNKGQVPNRKKECRNPRVRHRMKFRKANIRRKGQVRGVVKEIKRYAGEPSGININVVKSVKYK